jgi:cyclic beta-1,2-glucan synthetase
MLGLQLRDGRLELHPCLPRAWDGFEADVRGPDGSLAVRVRVDESLTPGARELSVDGAPATDAGITLPSDVATHTVELRMGRPAAGT